ncbi:hypothetical protein L596_005813 [Steinernema carpocapsae]|uniref:Uncharacterized protein n=1 Tax=Steinernema carpocapsae TaxID=34508 RepID=A0A4U8V0B7_STECR|nr:hypothetical protein L596_005813 [Steinernema carpocapsae]
MHLRRCLTPTREGFVRSALETVNPTAHSHCPEVVFSLAICLCGASEHCQLRSAHRATADGNVRLEHLVLAPPVVTGAHAFSQPNAHRPRIIWTVAAACASACLFRLA